MGRALKGRKNILSPLPGLSMIPIPYPGFPSVTRGYSLFAGAQINFISMMSFLNKQVTCCRNGRAFSCLTARGGGLP